jgi:hypothetical protein
MGPQLRLQRSWHKKVQMISTFALRYSQVDVQVFAISSSLITANLKAM